MSSFSTQYAETLYKICQMAVVITDRDNVIACSGASKKEYMEKRLSEEFDAIMNTRSLYSDADGTKKTPVTEGSGAFVRYAMPIITEGDVVGCIASLYQEGEKSGINDAESKLIQTAASFLGKQFEG